MQQTPSHSSMPQAMRAILIVGILGCVLFAILYDRFRLDGLISTAIACGVTAYHILLRFGASWFLNRFFHRRYDPDSRWFRPKPWEAALYRRLRVKAWKAHVTSYDPTEFSLQIHSPAQIVLNMCHAERVHELNMVLSFTALLFAIPFGALPVFFITSLLAALFDGIFVIMQRYNRPRMAALARHSHPSL